MKIDRLKIILLAFILTCYNENYSQDLNGYWYRGYTSSRGTTLPILYNFNNGILQDCFEYMKDTIRYEIKGKKVHLLCDNPHDLMNRYSIVLKNGSLQFSFDKEYSYTLKKSESENFVLDYMANKQVKITLPKSTQKEGKTDISILGIPLYFGTVNNELVVHFYNTTVKFDNNFYKAILTNQNLLYNLKNHYPITLVADKNISVKDLKSLFNQLSSLYIPSIICLTMPENYAEINYCEIDLPEISLSDEMMYNNFKQELINKNPSYYNDDNYEGIVSPDYFRPVPGPPMCDDIETLIEEGHVLIGSTSNGFVFNNNECAQDELRSKIKTALLSNPCAEISYYISNNLTCQDYVNLIDLIEEVRFELRNDYFTKTYGESHKEIKNNLLKNRADRYLYRGKLRQLNLSEYKKNN
jgi:biopolymer transport protein ExbD